MKRNLLSLFIVSLMITLSYLSYVGFHTVAAPAPPNPGVAIWTRVENPSSGSDLAARVVVDGTGMYVVGWDSAPGNVEWRIEKRSLGDGSVIWTQIENPGTGDDSPRAVVVDGTGLYVAGNDHVPGNYEWRIEKRSLTTGAVIWTQVENPSAQFDSAWAVAVDGSGVYIVGSDQVPTTDTEWRIEKRSLTTGAFITTFGAAGVIQENPSSHSDAPIGVAVDGTGLYVVGYDASPGASNDQWRIEKRSPASGSLIAGFGSGGILVDNPSGSDDDAYAVVVDGTGVYVIGTDQVPGNYEWRIEKLHSNDGSPISAFGSSGVVQENPSSGDDEPSAQVAIDGTGLYLAGYDQSTGDYEWRVEKLGLADGSNVWTQNENPSASEDDANGVAVDGTGVYVVGSDQVLGASNVQLRVEKRNPVLPGLWVVGISLVTGWNLISLPVVPISSAPTVALATVIAAGNITIVWSYTGTPTPSWKFFNPKLAAGNTLTAITDGMGLWLLMASASTLFVEGYVIPPAGSPSQYSLVTGWNLVGFKPAPDPTVSETVGTYLTSLPGSSYDANNIWLYDNPTGVWTRTNSGTSISPGQALWVLMLAPAKLAP